MFIEKKIYKFVQEGNTFGTTDETEILTLEKEYVDEGEEFFYVIKTTTGWSFDNKEELIKLIDEINV